MTSADGVNRDLLSAAARDIRTVMRRQQAEANALDPEGWQPLDPALMALAVECDEVVHGQRAETGDLLERIAVVLGEGWEPRSGAHQNRIEKWTLDTPNSG